MRRASGQRAPRATYRLQLSASFTFDDAVATLPYLERLGISHVYCSPILAAVPGSTHGYDVVDPTAVDPDRGGEDGWKRLVEAARANDLGLVLDIVPNHLAAVTPHNRWWWDVLEHGPDSRYASVFDIDWEAGDGRVLVPVLGALLEEELRAGTVVLDEHDGRPAIRYHEHVLPVRPGTPAGADIGDVLSTQHYELAYWRHGIDRLNYRRFFDITTLVGVRVEDPEVFAATHRRILEWVGAGEVEGLRVDHPDGLRDPAAYAERLREATGPDTWIVLEKILEPGEQPRPWPVDGTTGYEFATLAHGLQLDPAGEPALTRAYAELTGERTDWPAEVEQAKRQVLGDLFGAELARLTALATTAADALGAPTAPHRLRDALTELLVAFPVYRTYVQAEAQRLDDADVARVHDAVTRARGARPDLADVLDLLGDLLTLRRVGGGSAELVMRFQQLSGPVMAKGVEDTASYRYLRLVGLNEVGGDPDRFGVDVATFHAANAARQRDRPGTMLTTSTHDTKRSEDVRARLAVLSEVPGRWQQAATRWLDHAEPLRREGVPSRADLYLLLQTLVGAWPIEADRLLAYLDKAAREAKRHTHWLDVDAGYEDALREVGATLLADQTFLEDVGAFVAEIRDAGWANALAQALLRLTSPGVPDTYQGTELWDLSLVDPDNRRPVDFVRRRALLDQLDRTGPRELWARREEGVAKLAVVRGALRARRDRPDAFGPTGDYEPLPASGPAADHVVGYVRGGRVAVVVPRLTTARGADPIALDWGTTAVELPGAGWRDAVTGAPRSGGTAEVGALLAELPVALLVREDG